MLGLLLLFWDYLKKGAISLFRSEDVNSSEQKWKSGYKAGGVWIIVAGVVTIAVGVASLWVTSENQRSMLYLVGGTISLGIFYLGSMKADQAAKAVK
ncbi:hypothetical protein [Corynebacterium crudilactis]|uniref:hypothetical protein n=1 Tax=Corynebacterium crudilactis TaxID=1652495 RepID=UPI0012FD876B|nr:hypothetical protein [Corynebacterium crudilactis]